MWSRPLVPILGYKITKNSPAMVYTGDGSSTNVAATAHLVTEMLDHDPDRKNGIVNHVALVKTMSRLLHFDGLTSHQAELAAAHLCTSLSEALPQEMSIPVSRNFFFTDSTAVLTKLRPPQSPCDSWVPSRLRHLTSKTKPTDWYRLHPLS